MRRYETLTENVRKQISEVLNFTLQYDVAKKFDCGDLDCRECPFHKCTTTCDEQGSEERRNFKQWVEWLMEEI